MPGTQPVFIHDVDLLELFKLLAWGIGSLGITCDPTACKTLRHNTCTVFVTHSMLLNVTHKTRVQL